MGKERNKTSTILIVDDIPANVSLLEAILSPEYVVKCASSGSEALEIARKTSPDLIMLDIMMPGIDGYDVCRALKEDENTKRIPVIFVTALLNPGDETRGFEAGCVDYITKPVIGTIVRNRVKAHLALSEANNKLDELNRILSKQLLKSTMTLREKTEALQSLELLNMEIQDARAYAEDIVETVREPLVVLNSDLKILTANHSFYETFKVTSEETIGNFIYDLGNRQWDIPKLRILFEEILHRHIEFNGYEVEHDFQDIGRKIILLNARQIFRVKIGSHIILLAMEDITERKQLEEERDRLSMIVESSNDAIFSVSQDDAITSWNEGAENIFGLSAREIIGSPIFNLIPAERHHEKSHIWQKILSGEELQYFEISRIRKDGRQIYVSITTSPLLSTDGRITGNSVIARDVTEHRMLEDKIKHLAHYDTLTDLPNRLFFMELLALELARAQHIRTKLALMFLDLNGFKQVNDTLGHSCGDHLLQDVARKLKTGIRECDTVARLGGDEFTVLMPDLAHTDDVDIVLNNILKIFESPFILEGITVNSATSIGVSLFPIDGESSEELMKKADIAMYEAKASGRNSYRFYNAEYGCDTRSTAAQ